MQELIDKQKEFLKEVISEYFDQDPPDYQGFFDNKYFIDNETSKRDFYNFFVSLGFNPMEYIDTIPTYMCYSNKYLNKTLIIPDNILSIGNCAFRLCKTIEKVEIGEKVAAIGDSAFWGCVNLKEIYLPDSLKWIGSESFAACSKLERIVIPSGVSRINVGCFEGCNKLKEIIMPKYLEGIGLESIGIKENKTKVKFI